MDIHPMVTLYLARKALSEIGCTWKLEDIDDFEMECYLIIANKLGELQEAEYKKRG